MLHRMADTGDISALRTLAEVVEPVKDYARMENVKGPWDFRAPLNQLIDAVSPESDAARHFRRSSRGLHPKRLQRPSWLKHRFERYSPPGAITI